MKNISVHLLKTVKVNFHAVNGEKFQSHPVTLTLIGQCPMSNSSELFSYATTCSSFKWIEPLFFSFCVHRRKDGRKYGKTTDWHEYSLAAVDKLQL